MIITGLFYLARGVTVTRSAKGKGKELSMNVLAKNMGLRRWGKENRSKRKRGEKRKDEGRGHHF